MAKSRKVIKKISRAAFYKTILRTLLLENEHIAPARLRQIVKPYLRLLS